MPTQKSKRTNAHWSGVFKMKLLPKAEYALLRALCTRYDFQDELGKDDPSQLVVCLLRAVYEMLHMRNGTVQNGEAWWQGIIDQYRQLPDEERAYELPG